MSLDVELLAMRESVVHEFNITHNLAEMADAAGLYKVMWRPEEIGITKAGEAVDILREGIERLVRDRDKLIELEPDNGWGTWDDLMTVASSYFVAAAANPDARIEVSR